MSPHAKERFGSVNRSLAITQSLIKFTTLGELRTAQSSAMDTMAQVREASRAVNAVASIDSRQVIGRQLAALNEQVEGAQSRIQSKRGAINNDAHCCRSGQVRFGSGPVE